jgi:hypothetical protein
LRTSENSCCGLQDELKSHIFFGKSSAQLSGGLVEAIS